MCSRRNSFSSLSMLICIGHCVLLSTLVALRICMMQKSLILKNIHGETIIAHQLSFFNFNPFLTYLSFSVLFLDSLKMHTAKTYFRHICKWLNSEWKRLKMPKVGGRGAPFTPNDDDGGGMPLRTPKSESSIFLSHF